MLPARSFHRFARALRDELSDIICSIDIKATVYPSEDLLRSTSIVHIDVTSDLASAKVFVNVLGNSVEKRQICVWLAENSGQIRYSLAARLRQFRRVPDIEFKLEDAQSAELIALMEGEEFIARGSGEKGRGNDDSDDDSDEDDDEFDFEEDEDN
jgi:ribosome-binding factor A